MTGSHWRKDTTTMKYKCNIIHPLLLSKLYFLKESPNTFCCLNNYIKYSYVLKWYLNDITFWCVVKYLPSSITFINCHPLCLSFLSTFIYPPYPFYHSFLLTPSSTIIHFPHPFYQPPPIFLTFIIIHFFSPLYQPIICSPYPFN